MFLFFLSLLYEITLVYWTLPRAMSWHSLQFRSRILSASSYLRTVTPDRLQTLTSLTRAQMTRSCWRPDDTDLPSQNANGPYESDGAHVVCAHAWFICVDRVRDLIIIHVSLSNRSCTYIKCIFVCPVSPTVIRFTTKHLNRTRCR